MKCPLCNCEYSDPVLPIHIKICNAQQVEQVENSENAQQVEQVESPRRRRKL